MATVERLYDVANSFKEKSPGVLSYCDAYSEEELEGSELIIYNNAIESLKKILIPPFMVIEDNQYFLPDDDLDKPFVPNIEENYWSYYLKIRDLRNSFYGSNDYKLKAVEYGQNAKGSPVFLFFTQKCLAEDRKFLEMFTPLVLEIDEDMILEWFSKLTGIDNNIGKFVKKGEVERVLNRARNIGRYLNIVDNYEEIYSPER